MGGEAASMCDLVACTGRHSERYEEAGGRVRFRADWLIIDPFPIVAPRAAKLSS